MANINGTAGNETLTGGASADSINGLGGDDILIGGEGNDTLNGGSGNDRIEGGAGNDQIVGGIGTDTAVYAHMLQSGTPVASWSPAGVLTISTAGEGTDTLSGVEFVEFNGVTFAVNNTARNIVALIQNDSNSVGENGGTASGNVLGNDFDVDSVLTVSGVVGGALGEPLAGAHGTLILAADGSYSYKPNGDSSGTDVFTYQVTEAGAVRTATLTINVINENDAPVTGVGGATLAEDGSYDGSLAGLASDEDGDALTFGLFGGPANGVLDLNPDGTFTYTPNSDFFGEDGFFYTVSDGNGGATLGYFSLTVEGVNDAPEAPDFSTTLAEDSEGVQIPVLNGGDPDGDAISVTHVNGIELGEDGVEVDGGLVTRVTEGPHAGELFFTPSADYSGVPSFTYTLSDGTLSSTGTVFLEVTAVNDAPTGYSSGDTIDEDTVLNGSLFPLAGDADGDKLMFQMVSGPANGALDLGPGGSFTYTPNEDFAGIDSFTWRVFDGQAWSEVYTHGITVNEANDAPVGEDLVLSIDEDQAVLIDVIDAASDAEGDDISIVSVDGQAIGEDGVVVDGGVVRIGKGGQLEFRPDANFSGEASFTYVLTDGTTPSEPATVTINVAAVNDAPVAAEFSANLDEDQPLTGSLAGFVSDVDSPGPFIFEVVGDVAHGTLTFDEHGQFTYTPDKDWNGTDSFTWRVLDGDAWSEPATFTLNVAAVNDGPVGESYELSMDEDSSLDIDVAGDSFDVEGDALTVVAVNDQAVGPDGVAVEGGVVTLTEGGQLRFTPDANFSGEVSFTYRVADTSNHASDPATVFITVNPTEDAPVAQDFEISLIEDSEGHLFDLPEVDADGDELFVSIGGNTLELGESVNVTGGTVTLMEGNDLFFVPNADFNGAVEFDYVLRDREDVGGPFPAPWTKTAGNFVVNGEDSVSTGQSPTAAKGAVNAYFGTSLFGNNGMAAGITFNVSAGDTVSFQWTYVEAPGGVDHAGLRYTSAGGGSSTIATFSSNSLSYSQVMTFTGVFTLAFGVMEYQNAAATGVATLSGLTINGMAVPLATPSPQTSTGTISIDVEAVNDAPEAENLEYVLAEDQPGGQVIDVLGEASDADGDALSVALVNGEPLPAEGAVVEGGVITLITEGPNAGNLLFTPDPEFSGAISFDYVLTDGSGADNALSETRTVDLVVTPVNDLPVGEDASDTLDEDGALSGSLAGLVSDVDLGDGELTFEVVDAPVNGQLVLLADGTFDYLPEANFAGSDSFTWRVSDGDGWSQTYSYGLTVNPVNDAPTAADLTANYNEDSVITFNLATLGSDIEMSGLSIASINGAPIGEDPVEIEGGTLALNMFGQLVFTPEANFSGQVTFDYTLSDGELESEPATVTVNLAPVDDAPVAEDISVSTDEDSDGVLIDLATHDADGQALYVSIGGNTLELGETVNVAGGTVTMMEDNDLLFVPNPDFHGQVFINYTLSDAIAQAGGAFPAPWQTTAGSFSVVGSEAGIFTDSNVSAADIGLFAGGAVGGIDGAAVKIVLEMEADDTFAIDWRFDHDDEPEYADFAFAMVNGVLWASASADATIPLSYTVGAAGTYTFAFGSMNEGDGGWLSDLYLSSASLNGTAIPLVSTPVVPLSDSGVISIAVNAVNDAPEAANLELSMDEDQEGGLVVDVLGQASDVDGDTLSVKLVNGQEIGPDGVAIFGGVVTVIAEGPNAGNLLFTPNPDYSGAASFSYVLTDGEADTEEAAVDIIVNPVNDAPETEEGSSALAEDGSIEGSLAGLASDGDSEELTFALSTGPENGELVLNPDGSFTYTPDANFFGEDSFTWTVSDGEFTTSGTYSLTVTPVNDPPVAESVELSGDEDGAVIITIAGLPNVDREVLTVATINGEAFDGSAEIDGGVLTMDGKGNLVFTPDADFNGAVSFTYSVTDGELTSAEETVDIVINAVNDAPELEGEANRTTDEDTAISGQAAAPTDIDSDAGDLGYVLVEGLDGLTFNTETGAWTFDPTGIPAYQGLNQGESLTVQFQYAATDGELESDPVTVQIVIAGLVDAVYGGAGSDSITGTPFVDHLYGLDGDDTLSGLGDNDRLDGGAGDDVLSGGEGDDHLIGGDGHDVLVGGKGNDLLEGGLGDDIFVGGGGQDVVSYANSLTAVNANLATGVATGEGMDLFSQVNRLTGSGFDDVLTGNSVNNLMSGGAGNDVLSGGEGIDTLYGDDGADTLWGGIGGDNLYGGAGNDRIIGGVGNDKMWGGAGADTFVILAESTGGSLETDFIHDFNAAEGDRVDLSAIDANTLLSGDQGFSIVNSVGSGYGEMVLVYANGQTTLRLYTNGDKTVDYQIRLDGDHRGVLGVAADAPEEVGGWIL
ncbi:MAG: tandem-95 repeat protein [Caulobacter sp.]